MHIHILGICGTFMAGLAALARESGHRVSGSDKAAYPPMSTQLEQLGVQVLPGDDPAHLDPTPDIVIVGNVVSRGNAVIEYVLNHDIPYTSGPQWLGEHVLRGRHVLAVAGTHGKTTTASLAAHLLDAAGMDPGFLIGGVPQNFGVSARLGGGEVFVVEADEYDTAFFDKRSKFVHYRPRTLVLNNLEFDHADIFDDLAAIERQFHHVIRTVPGEGTLVVNAADANLARVLERGCWSQRVAFNAPGTWQLAPAGDAEADLLDPSGDAVARVKLPMPGAHNRANVLAALLAAEAAGAERGPMMEALPRFRSVKRRLECIAEVRGVTVFDDFAHHPTAIRETIAALRERHAGRIVAVLEPRSNTMRAGVHGAAVADALADADVRVVYLPASVTWPQSARESLEASACCDSLDAVVERVAHEAGAGDAVLIMSNGDFGGVHQRIVTAVGG